MKLIIRADSNKIVAMGHVMRCLSIADAVKSMGGETIFVCASDDSSELINSRGYMCEIMDTDFSDTMSELELFNALIDKHHPDVVLCDGYYFSENYFEKITKNVKVIYLDDYGKNAYKVDALINYNIYGDLIDYAGLYNAAKVDIPKLFLGTNYAPLRQAFLDAKPVEVSAKEEINILVSTGGADLCNVARALCDKFLNKPIDNARLNILVGPFSKDREYIKTLSETNPDRIGFYEKITDMPEFLKKFDIALSAAGSTTYELCRMGIPTCLFCSADNQSMINQTFKEKGLCESAGNAENNKSQVVDNLLAFAEKCAKDIKIRSDYSEKMKRAVDAKGAFRIAEAISSML